MPALHKIEEMQTPAAIATETSLDPKDWKELKNLAHEMVDDMFAYLEDIRKEPAWRAPSLFAKEKLREPLPVKSTAAEEVYQEFKENILPFNLNNIHPRFWAWVQGGGTPLGMIADMLASGMNPNMAIGNHIPMYVELQVIDWCKQIFGFPAEASGIIQSGASMANITALIVARNTFLDNCKQRGLTALGKQLIVYGSEETHNCLLKAVEVIGLGSEHFRKIKVNDDYTINIKSLLEQIEADKINGFVPFCIVGNAGTVNTGAIDDLSLLTAIAKKEKMWFHVDGAFGAIPKILPEFEKQLKGLEDADSLSFDFHKWMYMNYEAACVLIRNKTAHKKAFSTPVNYLMQHDRGLSSGPESFSDYGMELSRGFKSLKIWMSLKTYGLDKYRELVRQNLEQVKYLVELIDENKELELMAPAELNIACFRFNPFSKHHKDLNSLNKEILMRLHEQGIATPSYTILKGNYVIRVAHTNHRTRKEDFDILINGVIRLGHAIINEDV
ncbi:MAG: amino acid decarboxylase [Chitinophagaceae bacterium]|nr:amino acid decarboxylase [Chitinophagaceae bacterium]